MVTFKIYALNNFEYIICNCFLDFYLLIYFWLCWVFVAAWAFFLAAASGGYFLVAVCRLLIAVASDGGARGL